MPTRTRTSGLGALLLVAQAATVPAATWTYTLDADFDLGEMYGVNHDVVHDQLQLNPTAQPHPYLWVAASDRGTVVKIDVRDGRILGEYLSAPDGRPRDPSRTSVDRLGNVWVGNRDESSPSGVIGEDGRPFVAWDGSVVKIGLLEQGGCVDRNGNGVIDTSQALGDVRGWTNAGGVDTRGGIATAEDECIIVFRRVDPPHVRQVAIDLADNVWVGGDSNQGLPEKKLQLLDGRNGAVLRTIDLNSTADTGLPPLFPGFYGGGYGGFVDCHGHVWSAGSNSNLLLRLDPSLANGAPGFVRTVDIGATSYGLGLARNGHIWHTTWRDNTLLEIDDDLAIVGGPYATSPSHPGNPSGARGVAVSPFDGSIWVANSGYETITRHRPDGSIVAVVPVGRTPTGVAIDLNGKVWVTNLASDNVMRIDPATNSVDLTVPLTLPGHPILLLGGPYNYSDMTGIIALVARPFGRWTIVTDAGCERFDWTAITWNASEPAGTSLDVEARASETALALAAEPWLAIPRGVPYPPLRGRLLQTRVNFRTPEGAACGTFASPALLDLSVDGADRVAPQITCPPDRDLRCDEAPPVESPVISDNCTVSSPIYSDRRIDGPCAGTFTLRREWSVTDAGGNTAACVQELRFHDDVAPQLDPAPADLTVECSEPPPATLLASDSCSASPSVELVEQRIPGPCPHDYTLIRTWTATDDCGNSVSTSQQVHVVDTEAPVLLGVPEDMTVECEAPPPPAVTATDGCSGALPVVFTETRTPGPCPNDYTLLRIWSAVDECGHAVAASRTVRVLDTMPPVIQVTGGPGCLWPPNHSYVCFQDAASFVEAQDACPGEVRVVVTGCRSDQPDDQQGSDDRGINGDGNTEHDCVIAVDGSGFCVRSERLGQCKAGRTYGVTFVASDDCGNSASTMLSIHVPHDQREHPDCAPARPQEFIHRNESLPFDVTWDPAPDAGLPDPFTCP